MTRVERSSGGLTGAGVSATAEPQPLGPGEHAFFVAAGSTVLVTPLPPPGRSGHWTEGTKWSSNATTDAWAPRSGFEVRRVHEPRPIEQILPSRQVFSISIPAEATAEHRYGVHLQWRDRNGERTAIRCVIELRVTG